MQMTLGLRFAAAVGAPELFAGTPVGADAGSAPAEAANATPATTARAMQQRSTV
jgi:hypothetical protein